MESIMENILEETRFIMNKYNIKANITIYSAIKHSGIVLSSGCLLSLD